MARLAALKGLNKSAQGNALGLRIDRKSSPERAIHGTRYDAHSAALSGLGLTTAPETQGVALG